MALEGNCAWRLTHPSTSSTTRRQCAIRFHFSSSRGICGQKLRLGSGLPCRRSGLADRVFDRRHPHAGDGRPRVARTVDGARARFSDDRHYRSCRRPVGGACDEGGVVDFIEKPFASETILDSLRGASSRLASPNQRDPAAAAAIEKLALLSAREREVLAGLIAGLPNKSIAYDLEISPRTVEIYRARVMGKMGARNLSELIRLASAAGMQPQFH